jgi:hypothetical protein
MLNEALQVAHRRQVVEQEQEKVAELLQQLPVEVLHEIATTGQVKLAYCEPMSDGQSKAWVEQFKGTPFFQQAIALEQEDLQAQMARQQEDKLMKQKSESGYEVMDQIRLKKKLLELQKARNEAQVLDVGAGPVDMTGSNTQPPMTPDAQGAGAAPMAPDSMGQKTAGKYDALKAVGAVGAGGAAIGGVVGKIQEKEYKHLAKENPNSRIAQFAAKHPVAWGASTAGATTAAMGGLALRHHLGSEIKSVARGVAHKAKDVGSAIKHHTVGKARAHAGKKDIEDTTNKALGMLKSKPKGGEKHASIKIAMDPKLMSTLKSTAGAGAKIMGGRPSPTNVGAPMTQGQVAGVKVQARKGTLLQNAPAAKVRPLEVASDPFAKAAEAKVAQADAWGRELARADAEKIAHSREILETGEAAGRLLAKTAGAAGMLGAAGKWALEHPQRAGAIAGGAMGAAHGLMKEDGGIGSALTEGAVGAGLGHAAGGIGGGMRGGNTLGDSAKMYGAHVHNEAGKLSDKVRAAWKSAPKPETALGGGQVQKTDVV